MRIIFFDVFRDSPLDGWIPPLAEDGVVVLGDVLPVILNEVKHLL